MNNSNEKPAEATNGGYKMPYNLKQSFARETSFNSSKFKKNYQKPQEDIVIHLTPLLEIWESLQEEMKTRGTSPKYPIGLKVVDEITWGVHKKQILTIGGRTSMGKSDFSLFIARQLADVGQKVIYFSLEMSKEQLLERLFSAICMIDNSFLRLDGAQKQIEDNKKVFEDWINSAKLLIDTEYGYVYDDMVEVCRIIKPDFVIVDYVQMISTTGFKNKLEALEEYVRMLKQLSMEMNFGVILISQLNRGAIGNPNMGFLKHAGVLEEHSDTVLTLLWDWDNIPTKFVVNVEKQRHGKTKNNLKIKFEPQFSDFKDIENDDEKKTFKETYS